MYRNVLFRAIIDGMQWGRDGRESKETSAVAHGGEVTGLALTSPNSSPSNPMSQEEGP